MVPHRKPRGLLVERRVDWGGEFGGSVTLSKRANLPLADPKRASDPHACCFRPRIADLGVKPGITDGAWDDCCYNDDCYNIVENCVPIHDLQTTFLHLLQTIRNNSRVESWV